MRSSMRTSTSASPLASSFKLADLVNSCPCSLLQWECANLGLAMLRPAYAPVEKSESEYATSCGEREIWRPGHTGFHPAFPVSFILLKRSGT
jgi:hypothetical protein